MLNSGGLLFDSIKFSMFKETQPPIGMDSGTNEIISRIKFIGRIQKGEKINVRYMYVQPDSWITKISRTFFATDTRMNSFHFIENTIKRSFEIITLNKDSTKISERCLVINIIADLKSALEGIINLKDTYGSDVMFCCKLDTLVQETTSKLVEIEQTLQVGLQQNDHDSDESISRVD